MSGKAMVYIPHFSNIDDVVAYLERELECQRSHTPRHVLLLRLNAARWLRRPMRNEPQTYPIARVMVLHHEIRDPLLDVVANRHNPYQLHLEVLYNRVSMERPEYEHVALQWKQHGF